MKVVITAATTGEWMPTFLAINPLYTSESKRFKVLFHQSGVGMLATAVSLMQLIADEKPDLIIQAGIAGTFDATINLGKVVVVQEENLGDMGVQEDGKWKDIFELKLEKSSYPPYERRKLPNPFLSQYNLLKLAVVNAITVNQISTNENSIAQLTKKYNPSLESMEGAALHYVCREMNIPFLQIRAVSNFIGERDKTKWQMKLAIDNLNETLLKLMDKLYKMG
jgi:futalosine hydrolase